MATHVCFIDELREKYGRYFCRRCADKGIEAQGSERYSMRVYAGMYCEKCWDNDGRNHEREFDPLDAGESFGPEDY